MSQDNHTIVVPEVIFLGNLISQILSGKIRIPEFQRPLIWTQKDVLNLLDSVYRGSPIGSILLWDTDTDIQSATNLGPIETAARPSGMVGYILDGQQRITALVGTLQLPDESPSVDHHIDWRVYFDLEKSKFLRRPKKGEALRFFPISSLVDAQKFLSATRHIENNVSDELQRRHCINKPTALLILFVTINYQLFEFVRQT